MSTIDPAQHGHVGAAGPTSHEDAETVAGVMRAFKGWVELVARVVFTSQPHEGWDMALFSAIIQKYDAPAAAPVQHPALASAASASAAAALACLPETLPPPPSDVTTRAEIESLGRM